MELKGQAFDLMQYVYSFVQKPLIRGCIRFNGKLKGSKLKGAVKALISFYPILRCKYDVKKGVWRESNISYENLLISIRANNDFSVIENDSLLSSLEIGMDAPLKIYWICGEERDSLCVIASHLLCDGRGLEQLLYLFAELYSNNDIRIKTRINTDRSFSQISSKFTVMQKAKILFSRAGTEAMDGKLQLPLNEGSQKPKLIAKKIDLSKLERYRSRAIGYSPSINDILLSAYILALHQLFGWKEISIPCPVDLRRFNADADGAICNLTGNYYCHISFHGHESFEKICKEISMQICAQKNSSFCLKEPILLHLLYRVLPFPILKKLLPPKISVPLTSYTNLGKIEEARLVFQGLSVSDAFIVAAAKPVPYFQLAISTYKSECTLSACTEASGKSFDLLSSLMNSICCVIENLS